MLLKYENVSELPQSVAGVGLVKPGETVEVPKKINNKNFKIVGEAAQTGSVTGVAQPNVADPARVPVQAPVAAAPAPKTETVNKEETN